VFFLFHADMSTCYWWAKRWWFLPPPNRSYSRQENHNCIHVREREKNKNKRTYQVAPQ
jgi:hypothetical protein